MRIYRTDVFPLPLPEGHRFPAEKYTMLARRLVDDGILSDGDLRIPREATREELLRVHTRDYLQRLEQGRMTPAEMRRIGLPWSTELVRRAYRYVGATVECTVAALDEGTAISLAGGTHHAFADRGEGYCLLNDVAVAARAIQATKPVKRILVIDADVHQGNGTAVIFQNDPSVFTFSIHGMNNFPLQKQASDLDVGLPDGTGDDAYLEALGQGLAQATGRFAPELVIYLAGADPHRNDRYGHMALTKQGLAERDRQVLAFCRRNGSPVAVTMAGGYGRNTADTVAIHVQTVKIFYHQGNANQPFPNGCKP
jgi:acetoin utilization deacetylase AcuC-like enzyme